MHTVWVRLNAVVFFSLSVLLVLALLASFSAVPSILGDNGNPDHPMEAVVSKVKLNTLKSLRTSGGVDRALFSIDIDADFTPAFHWNVKQLFVFVVAEFATNKNPLNEVVLWDKIIESTSPSKTVHVSDAVIKYSLISQHKDLRGRSVTLREPGKVYPPMTQAEVESILDDIPIYSVTDSNGQGVVLKNPATGTSIFYFYVSPGMANATMGELKKSNPALDLRVTAYRLGQVYFKILKNETSSASAVKLVKGDSVEDGAVKSEVDYRLVPDTRDLIGARMLLTMSEKDGEELQAAGGMTEDLAKKAIKRAMTESTKFNETYGEIPVFMIQQMRIQTKATPTVPAAQMLPMYFSLSDMVSVWQQFAASDPQAGGQEPAIHLMELDELVTNMMAGGEIDFRSFPSDESLSLSSSDPLVFHLRSSSINREKSYANRRMEWVKARRIEQAQKLARRKAERETVENYTQTPYRAQEGLRHGIDVMSTRFQSIDGKMMHAKSIKADQVLGKFANYMRKNMLRVSDMIDRVDTSCDGVVDEEELKAAIEMVGLGLTDEEVHTLFGFLDASGDGTIDAHELETAMSDHRRVNYERTSMMSYMERTQLTKRNPMMTAEKVLDARLLSIPGTKGGKRQINSIPQLGQHLINTQFTEEFGDHLFAPPMASHDSFTNSLMNLSMKTHELQEKEPTAVQQQADAAILQGNINDRAIEQEYANKLIARRREQREVVARRRAKRELLETRAGQRAEDSLQKAQAFYEGRFGEVSILIKEARNIEMADANGTDGFCKVHFDGDVQETSCQWNTLHPVWNETFTFILDEEKDMRDAIKVELYDQDPHEQEFLGETTVHIANLEPMRKIDIAVELQKATTGSMYMSVLYTPVDEMIKRKARELEEEKHNLANKMDPELAKIQNAAQLRARTLSKGSSKGGVKLSPVDKVKRAVKMLGVAKDFRKNYNNTLRESPPLLGV
ncbi:hypothetical protein TrRE_jg7525 [Triparma retinervis]|uniref:Signal peptidase complex subunit 3 n=1 Tax=Triparma retinervis TaxID=2557542 RepID=A0A9W7FCK6_9STRA|nr:hypothetical protein TrRE_jg7525 [Triparma retinervis]